MTGLALHTSSPALAIAVGDFQQCPRVQVWDLGRSLSTHLHHCFLEFFPPQQWSTLSFIAVDQGPGSFTGTRIGVVAAKTLAQQLDIPLFGISSLAAIAQCTLDSIPSSRDSDTPKAAEGRLDTIAVQMRAQRGECYGALYQSGTAGVTPLLQDSVFSLSDWQQTLSQWPQPYHLVVADEHVADEHHVAASVTALLTLAWHRWHHGDRSDWSTVLPFYGQHPVVS